MKKILKIFYFLLMTINVFSQKNISLPLIVSDSFCIFCARASMNRFAVDPVPRPTMLLFFMYLSAS